MRYIIENFVLFAALVLVQVLICDHIVLFNIAVPLVFIYFIIRQPVDMNGSVLYTLAFLAGFVVDVFSDTPGMNSLCCVITAALKRPVLFAYVQKDDKTESVVPAHGTLGFGTWTKYLLTMCCIYCLLLFSIEYFSVSDVKEVLIHAAASGVFTSLLLLAVDSLMFTPREKRL